MLQSGSVFLQILVYKRASGVGSALNLSGNTVNKKPTGPQFSKMQPAKQGRIALSLGCEQRKTEAQASKKSRRETPWHRALS